MAEQKTNWNPSLSNPSLKQAAQTASSMMLTFHEILTKVNNAKDKTKKVEILRQHDRCHLSRCKGLSTFLREPNQFSLQQIFSSNDAFQM